MQGQVSTLIQKATDPANLWSVFEGWAAWCWEADFTGDNTDNFTGDTADQCDIDDCKFNKYKL